jgi:uncharacterized protein YaaQ
MLNIFEMSEEKFANTLLAGAGAFLVILITALFVHATDDEVQERRAILSTICQDNRMAPAKIGRGKFCVDNEGRLYSRSKLVDNKY